MRPNTSVKYSLFLIFLTLGHEFSLAYRVGSPLSADALKRPAFQESELSKPRRHNEDFKEFEDTMSANASDVEVVHPSKRWVAALALGVSIGISLAEIGVDIWLKVGKCCSPYPVICTYRNQFFDVQKRLILLFPKVDFAAITAKNTLEDITQTNYRLIEIYNDMKRIRDLKVQLLTRISASTIKNFNNKWNEIEKQLKNANETIRQYTYAKFNVEFSSFLDHYKTALLGFTPLFTYGLALVAIPAFNSYKQNSLNKEITRLGSGRDYKQLVTARHGKAAKILGVKNINQHIKATGKARNDVRFRTGKYTKFVNGVSIASVLISVGVAIYSTYTKIVQCRDLKSSAKKGRDDIVKGEKKLLAVYKNATDYISYIEKRGYTYLKGQLSGQAVLVELEAIRKLAKGAGKTVNSKNLTIAAASIDAFIIGISDANSRKTLELASGLADGLARVKILYLCYNTKVSLVEFCVEMCKNGTGTVETVFASGLKHFDTKAAECLLDVGVPYYKINDMRYTLSKRAPKENFQADCILNDPDKKDRVCRLWNVDRYTKPAIQKQESINLAQVNYFLTKCKPYVLNRGQKISICALRKSHTDAQIFNLSFLPRSVTLADIKAVTCPVV